MPKINVEIRTEEGHKDLEELKDHAEDVKDFKDEVVDEIDKDLSASYMKCLSLARSAYTIGLGMVKATGVSVSYFFRSMISAAFGAVQMLAPLLTARALATGDYISMALGFAELSVAIAATIAAQAQEGEIARGFRGAAMTLGGLSSLLGQIPRW